jgi:hypothetical protein
VNVGAAMRKDNTQNGVFQLLVRNKRDVFIPYLINCQLELTSKNALRIWPTELPNPEVSDTTGGDSSNLAGKKINSQLSTLNSQLSTLNSQLSTLNSQLSTLNSQPETLNLVTLRQP